MVLSMMLVCFTLLRLAMAALSISWHVPDETWQSVEVAHDLVFGFGYRTWEWREAIRSHLHPLLFVPVLALVKALGIDTPAVVVMAPRLMQAVVSAAGDVCAVKFYDKHFEAGTRKWFLLFYASQWFLNYSLSRTLINSLETVLASVALLLYPKQRRSANNWAYVLCLTLCFCMRPTAAVMWGPLVASHLLRLLKDGDLVKQLFAKMIPVAAATMTTIFAVDSFLYGRLVFVPWNFFKWNVLHDVGSHYGTHPWHWYLTSALPVMATGVGLIPLAVGLGRALFNPRLALLSWTLVWTVCVFSLIPHKEMRFLLPLLPLACCFAASGMGRSSLSKGKLMATLALNVPLALYLSLVHQTGNMAVIAHLSHAAAANSSTWLLMPCHSTPFYSHLHRRLEVRFLACEPNLSRQPNYVDEADVFYSDPSGWLRTEMSSATPPTFIALFDVLVPAVTEELTAGRYSQCASFFHSPFPEGRVGARVVLFCKG
jgi:phosphatidylinositol glycan class B